MQQQHINNLDGFRGFAALVVVVSHYSNLTGMFGGVLGEGGGQAGVMLFFMLTGFLIGKLHLDQEFTKSSLVEYVFKRVARVYPLFLLVSALPAFLAWSGFPGKIALSEIDSVSVYLGQVTLVERGFSVLWTIQIEFIFYMAFIAIWFFASRAGKMATAATLLGITCLLVAGGLNYGYDFFNRCHYFIFGLIAVNASSYKVFSDSTKVRSVIGVLLLLSVPVTFPKFSRLYFDLEIDSWRSFIVMVQFVALFVLVVSDRYYLSAILSWGPLRWVGKISYSVYLLHYFVLLSLLSWLPSSGSYLIGFSLVLAVTLLVSWLSYKFVERPLQRVVLALLKSFKYSERLSESGRT